MINWWKEENFNKTEISTPNWLFFGVMLTSLKYTVSGLEDEQPASVANLQTKSDAYFQSANAERSLVFRVNFEESATIDLVEISKFPRGSHLSHCPKPPQGLCCALGTREDYALQSALARTVQRARHSRLIEQRARASGCTNLTRVPLLRDRELQDTTNFTRVSVDEWQREN